MRGYTRRYRFGAVLSGLLLGGCAIHPVQRDVTHIPSQDIVTHIRCEARQAVFKKALAQLEVGAQRAEHAGRFDIALKYRDLSMKLQNRWNDPEIKFRFSPSELPTPRGKAFYKKYVETVIAYDFLMEGTEVNSAALAADPVRLISGGTLGLTVGGSGSLTRDNSRHFRLADTFKELLELPKDRCVGVRPENFVYPISGLLGLDEVIDTFVDINEIQALDSFAKDDAQVFADTMKFTTAFSGGLTPHVEIAAVGSRAGLAAPATINVAASRTDVHTLIVGLAMGTPVSAPSIGLSLTGLGVVGRRPASNKEAAHGAIDGIIQRNFYENFRAPATR